MGTLTKRFGREGLTAAQAVFIRLSAGWVPGAGGVRDRGSNETQQSDCFQEGHRMQEVSCPDSQLGSQVRFA